MIKILFVIPTLGHGGAERVLVNLVNHMDQQKFSITVQTLFDVGIYRNQFVQGIRYLGGFRYYFPGNTHFMKLFSPDFLFRYYIKEKYDIIVSYLEGSSARVVAGCNDSTTKLIDWIHISFDTRDIAQQTFRSYTEACRCYSKFHKICCVSETVKENFQKQFPMISNVGVFYNTVESDKIRMGAKESFKRSFFSENCINICSVAKLMRTKGYDRLIKVTAKLIREGFNLHVTIVGCGEEQSNLEKLIRNEGIEDFWTFAGFQANPYKYVANSDLYVCSSRREGFSTAVTEALIVGTPVVSTDCSGARELLGYNNEYGVVVENSEEGLYQGLRRMLTEKGLLEHYKKQAQKRGEMFDVNSTVKQVEDLFLRGIAQ